MKTFLYLGLAGILFSSLWGSTGAAPRSTSAAVLPNIVLILTDDQRWDMVCGVPGDLEEICDLPLADHPMPTIEAQRSLGAAFTNVFVSNPLCCPVRASMLSGGYLSHNTNVLTNELPNGGAERFTDTDTLPTRLQVAGYKTALIGKYLNHYKELVDYGTDTGYIPPGWSLFAASPKQPDWRNNYEFVVGSSTAFAPGTGPVLTINDGTYITDYERDTALTFIDDNCSFQQCDQPFFLFLSTHAPHRPSTPAPRHDNLFPGYVYRDRGYGEQPDGDVTDKPLYVQDLAENWSIGQDDEFHRKQLRAVRAVDEAVAAILANLSDKDLLGDTYFIFASDNGNLWGEHKTSGKGKPYEESIRVPLIMWGPTITPGLVLPNMVFVDLDLAPTIQDLANINPAPHDGRSLLPLLDNPGRPWRTEKLIENFYSNEIAVPSYASIRTTDGWKYIEYVTGEKELYSLVSDPFELQSLHDDPDFADEMASLATRLANLGRGVAIKTDNLPDPQALALPPATVSQPYSFQFAAWGGNGTYLWSVHIEGSDCPTGLPRRLRLNSSGLVSGTPRRTGTFNFCIKVEDTSDSPQPGNDQPQHYIGEFELQVNP